MLGGCVDLLALRQQRARVDCALSVGAVAQAGEAAGLDVAIGTATHTHKHHISLLYVDLHIV